MQGWGVRGVFGEDYSGDSQMFLQVFSAGVFARVGRDIGHSRIQFGSATVGPANRNGDWFCFFVFKSYFWLVVEAVGTVENSTVLW